MNNNDETKELNNLVDRLVAGEKMEPGPDASGDVREKLAAAERLLACTADPDPTFQANLRSQLVARLERGEVGVPSKAQRPGIGKRVADFFSAAPPWRTAAVAVAVGIVTLLVFWAAGLLPFVPGSNEPPIVGTTLPQQVKVESAAPGAVSAAVGTQVRVDILFRNTGSDTVTLNPYPPEIWINNPLDRMPLRVFPAGTGAFQLLPSGKTDYTLVWDQRDSAGQQVAAGTYTVSVIGVTIVKDGAPSSPFDVPNVVQIEITP